MALLTTRTDAETTFLAQLGLIDRVVSSLARRHALEPDEADDFASYVKAKLVENGYAVFEKFQDRSSMATYLSVVIANLFRDFRTQQWGRWRPSAAARRLGTLATRLEGLLYRDGHTLRQATEVLRSAGLTDLSDREIAKLAAGLPVRVSARLRPAEEVDAARTEETVQPADAELWRAEQREEWKSACDSLERALANLPPEDQLILRLRFWENFTVAEIARTLQVEQKPLYRRIENDLEHLRDLLEAEGLSGSCLAEFLSDECSG